MSPVLSPGSALCGAEDPEDIGAASQAQAEHALCGAEDPEDIRAASQAQAEHVAAMAEFSESPSPEGAPEEELSKAEQEIAALVEQLTPIERYAMNFLEASLEDVSREELKQAEEQVEAARKDIDQAKGGGGRFRLPPEEEEDEEEEEEEPSGGVANAGGGALTLEEAELSAEKGAEQRAGGEEVEGAGPGSCEGPGVCPAHLTPRGPVSA
ncbi:helicase SRCAP-like [Molothrus ater]|uniref:helicase SRCAP-like n=1 Tax=Molothrus ater TaxID=84834 RepID=UPI00174EBFFD|nr:helicase SRCAP-like [Molothrus ater]